MVRRLWLRLTTATAAAAAAGLPRSFAQGARPSKPVHIVVGFPVGGASGAKLE